MLSISRNHWKDGFFIKTREVCSLHFYGKFLRGNVCRPIAPIKKVSIFLFFFAYFTENQRVLKLVWSHAEAKVDCIYQEIIIKKAVIFKVSKVCSLHFFGNVPRGVIFRFFLFSVHFTENRCSGARLESRDPF